MSKFTYTTAQKTCSTSSRIWGESAGLKISFFKIPCSEKCFYSILLDLRGLFWVFFPSLNGRRWNFEKFSHRKFNFLTEKCMEFQKFDNTIFSMGTKCKKKIEIRKNYSSNSFHFFNFFFTSSRSHLRDIRDRSVLRLFESTDGVAGMPGPMGVPVGGAGLPAHWEDQSYFSEPEFDSEFQHQHIHKSKVRESNLSFQESSTIWALEKDFLAWGWKKNDEGLVDRAGNKICSNFRSRTIGKTKIGRKIQSLFIFQNSFSFISQSFHCTCWINVQIKLIERRASTKYISHQFPATRTTSIV